MDTKFKKGFTPWNKGTKGVMKPNSGTFKKGDNSVDLKIRFWQKVNKTRTCWLWTAATNNMGYGRINVDGKVMLAHRASYQMKFKVIPKGMCVLHKCDNPKCVNPKHLWLGTKKDNNLDRDSKGRSVLGEDRIQSKLNWLKVNKIRKMYKTAKYSQRELAKEFEISQMIINHVVNNKAWRI